jgi:hypothetical protein
MVYAVTFSVGNTNPLAASADPADSHAADTARFGSGAAGPSAAALSLSGDLAASDAFGPTALFFASAVGALTARPALSAGLRASRSLGRSAEPPISALPAASAVVTPTADHPGPTALLFASAARAVSARPALSAGLRASRSIGRSAGPRATAGFASAGDWQSSAFAASPALLPAATEAEKGSVATRGSGAVVIGIAGAVVGLLIIGAAVLLMVLRWKRPPPEVGTAESESEPTDSFIEADPAVELEYEDPLLDESDELRESMPMELDDEDEEPL